MLHNKLVKWVSENDSGLIQRSREWEEARRFTVGGSSIATIIGSNPYESINDFIYGRVGISPFKESIFMQWGCMFEPVIKEYIERKHECVIIGDDMYVRGPSCVTYSPDGLAVMNHDGEEHITLLEFKCPYKRLPGAKVPVYYEPQVLLGYDVLNIATRALFIEGVFRRSTFNDLVNGNNSFDRALQDRHPKGEFLAGGMIGFHYDADLFEARLEKIRADPYKMTVDDLVNMRDKVMSMIWPEDLVCTSNEDFTLLMSAMNMGIIKCYYSKVFLPGEISREIGEETKKTILCNIGLLNWKLIKCNTHKVARVDGFLNSHLQKIEYIINFTRKLYGQHHHDIIDAVEAKFGGTL